MQTEIETVKPTVVEQYISTDKAVENLKRFEELKTKLLSDQDYQVLQIWNKALNKNESKPFIKKSGWRKLALVFNLTDTIVYAKKIDRDDNSFIWEFTVKVSATNGRSTEAIGSCDSKERGFAHLEHDVKATAHTRAKSRGISDLIGAGEVSAEEMEYEVPNDTKTVGSGPAKEVPKGVPIKSGLEGKGTLG